MVVCIKLQEVFGIMFIVNNKHQSRSYVDFTVLVSLLQLKKMQVFAVIQKNFNFQLSHKSLVYKQQITA